MSKLPPLTNLPSWSRSSLERRKVQRCIAKDPVVVTSKNLGQLERDYGSKYTTLKSSSSNGIVSAPSSPLPLKSKSRKEAQLENNLSFLKEQHHEILTKLHEEIEKLKTENKELNFKLIVTNETSITSSALESRQKTSGSYYRSKIRRLENELKNLKLALVEAQKQNIDLSKRLSEREISGKRYKPLPPVASHDNMNDYQVSRSTSNKNNLSHHESVNDTNIDHFNMFSPGKTTVLQVTFGKKGEVYVTPSSGAASRSPTMSECKDIIYYLEDMNKRQGQELIKLKEEIKEGNCTANYSTDTYVVTKTLNGRTGQYNQNTSVILPALRPAGSGNVAERRRGQQAVLRGRKT